MTDELKWYQLDQNNSGGFFDADDAVCHRLFIEAKDDETAEKIAEDIGFYWDGVENGIDCRCCGDRWSGVMEVEFPLHYGKITFDNVEDYAQHLANEYGRTNPDARIFYADGAVVAIFMGNH